MAIGDVIRFTRTIELDGQLHVNVMHFNDQIENRPDQLAELLDQWDNSVDATGPENLLRQLIRGYTSIVQVGLSAQVIWPEEGEVFSRGFDTGVSSAIDSGLPTFSQVKFSIATVLNSRSGRGGFYIGGIPETETAGNLVTSAYTDKADNFMDALERHFQLGGADYEGFTLGVWSELLLDWNLWTSISLATDMGTMRSRRLGRGV